MLKTAPLVSVRWIQRNFLSELDENMISEESEVESYEDALDSDYDIHLTDGEMSDYESKAPKRKRMDKLRKPVKRPKIQEILVSSTASSLS